MAADPKEITLWVAVSFACLVSIVFVYMMHRVSRRNRADWVPDKLERRMIRHLHRELCIKPAMLDTDAPAVTLEMLFHASSGEVVETRRKTFFQDAPESHPSGGLPVIR